MSQAIDDVLDRAVDRGAVPNVVAVAADRSGVIYRGAAGAIAPDDDRTVDANTEYRIMSMTKMIVTAAALQQRDAGRLDFDAPVADYYPPFSDTQVLTGFDGDEPTYRAPARPATVRHLVTHTSGLGYWFWNEDLARWQEATGNPGVLAGTADFLEAPITFDPGSDYQYGINTDLLGRCVAAAAGVELDEVLSAAIFEPLGMSDTTYHISDEQRSRLTPVHAKDETGSWIATDVDYAQRPQPIPGGHGLYSTADDYLKFQRALLDGGELDGARILSSDTVDEAFSNQIGEIDFPAAIPTADPASSADFDAGPGHKWGWGLLLNSDDIPGRRRAGSGAWAGLCNTHFWVDRSTGLTGAIYTQTLPFVAPEVYQVYLDFETALYSTL